MKLHDSYGKKSDIQGIVILQTIEYTCVMLRVYKITTTQEIDLFTTPSKFYEYFWNLAELDKYLLTNSLFAKI